MTASDPSGLLTEVSGGRALLIGLFLLCYLIPGNIQIGSLTLGFPRLYLTLATIPCFFMFLMRCRIVAADVLLVAYVVLIDLAMFVNHGAAQIEFIGLQTVETLGAYLLGRVLLTGLAEYRLFWRCFGFGMLPILPIAVVELFTEQFVLHDALRGVINVFPSATIGYPTRLGFDRVQGNLEHPILFGVFWSLGLLSCLVVFRSIFAKLLFSGICLALVAMSLSSGAYLLVIFQLALMTWGWVTNNKWSLLLGIFAGMYLIVEMLSDRPALIALSTRLAFSADTAYWRVLIFEYGMQNVYANPFFGLGLRDWVRPSWLSPSVDNNWLLIMMRGGVPAFMCLIGAMGCMIFTLVRRKDLSDQGIAYRRAYLITFVAMFISLGTVAVWSGTQAFLLILLAMGVNLGLVPGVKRSDPDPALDPDASPDPKPGPARSRYSRYPVRSRGDVMARTASSSRAPAFKRSGGSAS